MNGNVIISMIWMVWIVIIEAAEKALAYRGLMYFIKNKGLSIKLKDSGTQLQAAAEPSWLSYIPEAG